MLSSIEQKRVGIFPQYKASKLVMDALLTYAAPQLQVQGQENLNSISQIIRQGTPTIFYPNHISNADGPILAKILESQGIHPVFITGLKLKNNPFTNILTRALTTIPIWPPSLRASKSEREKRRKTNASAFTASIEALTHQHPLVIFPEATRSRTGNLQKGKRQIAERYNHLVEGTQLVPVAIDGSDKMLNVGRILPKRRQNVTVSFGKPIDAEVLKKQSEKVSRRWSQPAIDTIMEKIASMLPPVRRGEYSS